MADAHDTADAQESKGLRERKQARVRAELIEAAMRLFLRQGFDETTVDQIAEAAEVSRRTLFRYFQTKGDILMAWTRGTSDFLEAALQARPRRETPLQSLREIFTELAEQLASNNVDAYAVALMIDRDPSLRQYSLQKHAEWEDRLAAVFIERFGASASSEQRAWLLARIGVASFRTALDQWIAVQGRTAMRSHLIETFALLDRSLVS